MGYALYANNHVNHVNHGNQSSINQDHGNQSSIKAGLEFQEDLRLTAKGFQNIMHNKGKYVLK